MNYSEGKQRKDDDVTHYFGLISTPIKGNNTAEDFSHPITHQLPNAFWILCYILKVGMI